MRITEGKTRFGKPIVYFGNRRTVQYNETARFIREIRSMQNSNLYYIGGYSITKDEYGCILELETKKDPMKAFRFLINEKKLYGAKKHKIDAVRIKNPKTKESIELKIVDNTKRHI